MVSIEEWLAHKAEKKRDIYQRYGKPLEKHHTGEYAAISFDGQVILSKRAGEVLRQAVDNFGSGNFGLFRVGHRAVARWLKTGR